MKRLLKTLVVTSAFVGYLAVARLLWALEPAADPALATVRIKSHGASATVIATTDGRSWILGCAHMLTDDAGNPSAAARAKKFSIDGPSQPHAVRKSATGPARLAAWDYKIDLSLLVIDNGPFHYIPVAREGFRPGKNLASVGYDNMAWPVTVKPATIVASVGDTTFTRERPWHGRSGGGLCDRDARVLIGVVQGYELPPWGRRGVYVSHQAILRFLRTVPDLPAGAYAGPVWTPSPGSRTPLFPT
jgi:hypothetical protein